jgi:hypothetical protein
MEHSLLLPYVCSLKQSHLYTVYCTDDISIANSIKKHKPVFWTRKFLGLSDPDPSVRGSDPDMDPSIIKQKKEEKP